MAAIDFETAVYGRDSACAVAVIRVEGLAIIDRAYYYIRLPSPISCLHICTAFRGATWLTRQHLANEERPVVGRPSLRRSLVTPIFELVRRLRRVRIVRLALQEEHRGLRVF